MGPWDVVVVVMMKERKAKAMDYQEVVCSKVASRFQRSASITVSIGHIRD